MQRKNFSCHDIQGSVMLDDVGSVIVANVTCVNSSVCLCVRPDDTTLSLPLVQRWSDWWLHQCV